MRTTCQTCARSYGKSLWRGSCICSGHVSLSFKPPGGVIEAQQWDASMHRPSGQLPSMGFLPNQDFIVTKKKK